MKKNTLAAALEPYGIYDGCEFRVRFAWCTYDCELKDWKLNPLPGQDVGIFDRYEIYMGIITGQADVTILPWEPKVGGLFWCLLGDGTPQQFMHNGSALYCSLIKAGNFARTEAELLSRKDEIMREIGMTE